MVELVSKSWRTLFQSHNACKILVSISLPAYYKKKIFHFFLSAQFTVLPIVSLIFFDMTFSWDYSSSKLFVVEHNGSFIQSTLSFHGISLSGCFVRNGKCEKLFIKIILSAPTCFSSADTHMHTQI